MSKPTKRRAKTLISFTNARRAVKLSLDTWMRLDFHAFIQTDMPGQKLETSI